MLNPGLTSLSEQAWRESTCRPARRNVDSCRSLTSPTSSRLPTQPIGHAPSCEDISSFLSGSLDGRMRGGGETSLWSNTRNAALRQSEKLFLRWRWVEATEEMTVGWPRGAAIKIPPETRGQVVNRLRSAVAEHFASRLLNKPDLAHDVGRPMINAVGDAVRYQRETLCALSLRHPFRRDTAEAQHCPAPPLEGYSPSRGSAVMCLPMNAASPSIGDSLGECSSVGHPIASPAAIKRPIDWWRRLEIRISAVPQQRNRGNSPFRAQHHPTARSKIVANSAAPNATTTITTARKSGKAAATRKSPTTATVSKPRVLSAEIVAYQGDPASRLAKRGQTSTSSISPPAENITGRPRGSRTSMSAKEKCGEGIYKKLPANIENPISTRTECKQLTCQLRRAKARWERVSQHSPLKGIILSSSVEEGTPVGVRKLR
ncbi:hypothetical protein G5I_11569 [Acromyrmex echinatior]|uniref:Uncharacterized protein n=1 Tax=Acromyrmex echinatior TaxID=103372 RepID=F4WZZ1_ACREC|nr:hypothetical protein G5I_11569 [Acromyrmex echinatior]